MSGEEIVNRLQAFWEGVSMAPVMLFGESTRIDLSTAQGRWELLVLAVLLGARVTERVVEETFTKLKDAQLLDRSRLALGDPETRRSVAHIFEVYYRALGHKAGKVDALIFNAKHLMETWQGDVHNAYHAAGGDSDPADGSASIDEDALVRSLQEFKHIKHLALWVCRTLKAHGIWRELGVRSTGYHDRFTRLPIDRLGLGADPRSGEAPADVLPLYLQGLNLCGQNDVKVCAAECPVSLWCPFPRNAPFYE